MKTPMYRVTVKDAMIIDCCKERLVFILDITDDVVVEPIENPALIHHCNMGCLK